MCGHNTYSITHLKLQLQTNPRPVRLAYQPPASSTFISEQTSHQQPASSTFLSKQTSTSHQPPAKRTGCQLPVKRCAILDYGKANKILCCLPVHLSAADPLLILLCSDCSSMLSWHSHALSDTKESESKWLQPWNVALIHCQRHHRPSPTLRWALSTAPQPLRQCLPSKRNRARWRSAVAA
jgi:hypothetical protein